MILKIYLPSYSAISLLSIYSRKRKEIFTKIIVPEWLQQLYPLIMKNSKQTKLLLVAHQQGNTSKFSLSLHWSTIQLTTKIKESRVNNMNHLRKLCWAKEIEHKKYTDSMFLYKIAEFTEVIYKNKDQIINLLSAWNRSIWSN